MELSTKQWLRDNALTVLDTAVDSIVTIDVRGTIQFVNRATLALFAYEESELIGQPLSKLMPDTQRSQHQRYINRYIDTGKAQIIGTGRELIAMDSNGREFPIYLAISEIGTGDEMHFAGIIRDLSEQKAAQAAIIEQRDNLAHVGRLSTMGEMTASIAHEINQPLTAIAMYAQASLKLLERDDVDRDKLKRALEKLNIQSLRAGDVIERIQRFVRNEGGTKELVDINALLRELSHLVSADVRMHGLELEFDFADNLTSVFCDSVQVQQVALNLIRNAIDAMAEINCKNGRTIQIATHPSRHDGVKEGIEVAITDSGVGINSEQEKQLFQAFHTTKPHGMGMGLSISRSIIDAHAGTLDFCSNPEHGCTFYFRLPKGEVHE
ncbi:MAG: PAS domain S-box protein [Pseudomonadales bacterium]|jgi:two-component system sensor kinase FixL|nr:PAS domain S-box protein [Pseudomonadales bacterium]MDP6472758.1 PAS domain S-box protein [Pseudomonadales bacterium]MDP6827971.1 PAS domain S-box protein [Pseudomonadales bacterium]MDP6972870.1 PAS domain S-box protein [Pseudomonadales bacterium]